jgi:hypothetical protein
MRVVISPKGENAPPAFAATTIFLFKRAIQSFSSVHSRDNDFLVPILTEIKKISEVRRGYK